MLQGRYSQVLPVRPLGPAARTISSDSQQASCFSYIDKTAGTPTNTTRATQGQGLEPTTLRTDVDDGDGDGVGTMILITMCSSSEPMQPIILMVN